MTMFPDAFLSELRSRYPLASAVQEAVDLKRDGKALKGCCPFHGEKTPSFTVFPDNRFKCFGCGVDGDVFSYIGRRHGVAFRDAVEHVASAAGVPLPDTYTPRAKPLPSPLPAPVAAEAPAKAEDWRPLPVTPNTPAPAARDLRCDTLFTYRDEAGRLLCYVRRHEAKGDKGKLFLPLTYGELDGRIGWHSRAPAAPRPLYGLDRLATRPDAPVIVCEGEKAADAAQRLFPDHVSISWMGGAKAVGNADWSPLIGRHGSKIMWPDDDGPGAAAAREIAGLVPGVQVLRVDGMGDGADAADLRTDDPAAWLRGRLPSLETSLPLLWLDDIEPVLDAQDFVQGVLMECGAAVVYGESNAGKTFWTTDLALHVAQGKRWNDRRVDQGGVVYCVLEGGNGFRNRVSAWRKEYAPEPGLPFAAIPSAINLLDPMADTPRLIETVRAAAQRMSHPVKLIVVDTLSRALAGGNENAPDDMGALVANMDRIRAETGACVLFVHHSGKDAAKGARGHSLLRAAIDSEIEVVDSGGTKAATVVKQRDMPKGAVFGFELQTVVLGQNQHGEDVTTCIVELSTAVPAPAKDRLTLTERGWLKDLTDMFAEPGAGELRQPSASAIEEMTLTRETIRAGFRKRGRFGGEADAKLTGADRQRMAKNLNALRDKGKIGMTDDLVWLLTPCQPPSAMCHG